MANQWQRLMILHTDDHSLALSRKVCAVVAVVNASNDVSINPNQSVCFDSVDRICDRT